MTVQILIRYLLGELNCVFSKPTSVIKVKSTKMPNLGLTVTFRQVVMLKRTRVLNMFLF